MSSAEEVPAFPIGVDDFLEKVIIPTGVSAPVVSAFGEVDRAQFMHRESRDKAYTDKIIHITKEATISQPSLVALMIDQLQLEGHEKVLEIGTATGYQAAVLSRLAGEIHTVEVNRSLAYWAKSNLERLQYLNVIVHTGDGAQGLESQAPFDAIIVTAGLREIPQALINQLSVGGRLVAPVGEVPENGRLVAMTKISPSETSTEERGYCNFVPLYSSENGGWTRETLEEARRQRKERLQARQADRRNNLKENILAAHGEEEYEEVIREIAVPVAHIVGLKEVTENQALDLLDFFSDVFRGEQQVEEVGSEEVEEATTKENVA